MIETEFGPEYYRRYYQNPATRVASEADIARLARFVIAYLDVLEIPLETVLDLGCGMGWWREPLAERYPGLVYEGVEVSEHLCDELGWTPGSVVDFKPDEPADLVICQGVLQYLDHRDARQAIDNLGRCTGQVLFLEVLTQGDWKRVADQERTDGDVFLRTVGWYRRSLSRHFTNLGGGVFIKRAFADQSFELERLD